MNPFLNPAFDGADLLLIVAAALAVIAGTAWDARKNRRR